MDFSIDDEIQMIAQTAKEFSRDRIRPHARQLDRDHEFPHQILNDLADLGLMNMTIPDTYGGTGLSSIAAAFAISEIAQGCGGVATSAMANDLGFGPILIGGTEEQKNQFIQAYVVHKKLCSYAQSEPNAGSDVAGIETRAVKVDGGWKISGSKQWITNASHASCFTVAAKTNPTAGNKGISVFFVEADREGVRRGKPERKLGQRASDTAMVHFEDVFVEDDHLIGAENGGFKILMKTLDASRPLVASLALGIARRSLTVAMEYASERRQFNRVLSDFQIWQFRFAEIAAEIEATWLTILNASWLLDNNRDAGLYSAIAKLKAAELAKQAADMCLQVHGGNGYTEDYEPEKLLRDARLMSIYEGTSEIQHIVIASNLLRKLGSK